MPFVAIDSQSKERIDLTLYETPKIELAGGLFECPVCKSPMRIRAGFKRRPHFFHLSLGDCIYAKYSSGETPEHLAGKEWLINFMRKEYGPLFPGAVIALEYHIPEAGRIADVALIFPGGYIHAYEIQLANITIESLEHRTRSYLDSGCDITWIVGNNAYRPDIVRWLLDNQGEAPIISFQELEDLIDG